MGWIGVDLDGTLAHYDGWEAEDHIGVPIPEMVERVRAWLADGRDVRIFTARVGLTAAEKAITAWCERHFGRALMMTNIKDHDMDELWDDRCVQVERNTGRIIGRSTRGLE